MDSQPVSLSQLYHHLSLTFVIFSASHSDRFPDKIPVADIKSKAKEAVNREARGVSAITLIKTARAQIVSAKEHEANGDLRSALASFIKAATLAKMAMDSNEYQEIKSRGGILRNELNDFLEVSLPTIQVDAHQSHNPL